jgi:hypothetical protein
MTTATDTPQQEIAPVPQLTRVQYVCRICRRGYEVEVDLSGLAELGSGMFANIRPQLCTECASRPRALKPEEVEACKIIASDQWRGKKAIAAWEVQKASAMKPGPCGNGQTTNTQDAIAARYELLIYEVEKAMRGTAGVDTRSKYTSKRQNY